MFGGSGSMAAEALSNGAKKAYAIEKDSAVYAVLRSNFAKLSNDLVAINGDSFKEIYRVLERENDEIILYIDPPFNIRDGYDNIYENVKKIVQNLKNHTVFLVAVEHASKVKFDEQIGEFSLCKTKKFGLTSLSYFMR